MIDVFSILKVGAEPLTVFGKIDEINHQIELNYQIINAQSLELREKLVYGPKFIIQLTDTQAQLYSIYGCKISCATMSIAQSNVVVLNGSFDRLIREDCLEKLYEFILFSFVGIEQIFPLEKFTTELEDDENMLKFVKEKRQTTVYKLNDELECTIESRFHNAIKSDSLVNLDIQQEKVIRLTFSEAKTVDELLLVLGQVKTYFEFILKQEIKISLIEFGSVSTKDFKNSILLYDDLLQPKTYIKAVPQNPYRDSAGKLFCGMRGWIQLYDKYSDVIEIWEKTIYNTHVSKDDLFIWRCQAFELLCTIDPVVYSKATALKGPKQAHPNLKNFLSATNEIYGLFPNIDCHYFKDVKEVRDKLTHNNPKKAVTEDQKYNSQMLIDYFFTRTVMKTFQISGIPMCIALKPQS